MRVRAGGWDQGERWSRGEPFLPYSHKRSRKAQSLDERLEGHDLVVEELLEFFLVQFLVCDWVTRA